MVEQPFQILVQLDDADADYLALHLEVQGMPLGPAKLSRAVASDFERLLQLALCFVDYGPSELFSMSRPVSLAIRVDHDQGDDFSMSFHLQGREFGPATITREAVEDLELLVVQGIHLVAGQHGDMARA